MISKMFEVYGTVSMHVFKSTCFPPEILHFCRHMYFYLKCGQSHLVQPKRIPYFVNGTKTNSASAIKGQ